ncbi:MAG: alpha/beta hydrolase, partial [Alphaproteobacteria bacterium]
MSLRAELLRLGIRIFLKRGTHHLDIETWRKDMRATEKFVPRPPARSQTTKVNAGRLTFHRVTTEASRVERHVLYLHGGAYVSGAPAYYRHFTWRIADAAKASVWALEYRLAPEHPFPAALEDAVAGYHWLLDNTPDPRRLFVMGDSAG